MYKIKIRGLENLVEVSEKQGEIIKNFLLDKSVKGDDLIEIGLDVYKKNQIVGIFNEKEEGASQKRIYEMSNSELEDLVSDFKDKYNEAIQDNEKVRNKIFGITLKGILNLAISEDAITMDGEKIKLPGFEIFKRKLNAIEELNYRNLILNKLNS